ncbi:MAG: class I SAM-dependent methyltransferase [Pseudomonadota bacterium]|nr:class I SAM-dependent methyltransferase [Pseudomonadota bacterium]
MAAPSFWIKRHIDRVRPGGHVLDVAAGGGRHVGLCRLLGLRVTAVDRDVSGLDRFAGDADVRIVEADLEAGTWPFPGATFDGVIVTNYLWRPTIPDVLGAVAPGGVLLWETFAVGNARFGRPRNPDFLLGPNELLHAVLPDFEVLAFESVEEAGPEPAVRQHIAARRPPAA